MYKMLAAWLTFQEQHVSISNSEKQKRWRRIGFSSCWIDLTLIETKSNETKPRLQ